MNVKTPKVLSALAAFFILGFLILWMGGFFETVVDPRLAGKRRYEIDDSFLFAVNTQDVQTYATIPGTTVAKDETAVASRLLARVERVLVRAGDAVARGQLLIELEKEDLEARVSQAGDRVKSVAAQREDARLRLERVQELVTRNLAASAEKDAAFAAFDSLSAQLDQARAALREAEIVLGFGDIKAPIGGRVVERLAEPGDTVSPAQPLLLLYDPSSIRVEAPVRESLAVHLHPGQQVIVGIDAVEREATGFIEEIVPAADPASRSFQVKVSIDYMPGLMPGMFARLKVPARGMEELLVPAKFVTEVGGLDLVYVYEDGQITRRYLRLGRSGDTGVVVTAGLRAGEVLVDPEEAIRRAGES